LSRYSLHDSRALQIELMEAKRVAERKFFKYGDHSELKKFERRLLFLQKNISLKHIDDGQRYITAMQWTVKGCRKYFSAPLLSYRSFNRAVQCYSWEDSMEQNLAAILLHDHI